VLLQILTAFGAVGMSKLVVLLSKVIDEEINETLNTSESSKLVATNTLLMKKLGDGWAFSLAFTIKNFQKKACTLRRILGRQMPPRIICTFWISINGASPFTVLADAVVVMVVIRHHVIIFAS